MPSTRTARVLAAAAALPFAAAVLAGVATADTGALPDDGSNAAAAAADGGGGGGGGGDNYGSTATTQPQAVGAGASSESNSALVTGSEFTEVDQSQGKVTVNFTNLW
ncbi:hypothetical protein ACFY93_32065 [Streptomyces sp. NPDC008313]|uniref:hypothetical protein n=1 Tax=Streptomyces sp. NPDC008313 TaxID=3364826 RepID=UPI0036ED42A5